MTTIDHETLGQLLAHHGLIHHEAIDDPEGYDECQTLVRIEKLTDELNARIDEARPTNERLMLERLEALQQADRDAARADKNAADYSEAVRLLRELVQHTIDDGPSTVFDPWKDAIEFLKQQTKS